VRQAGFQRCERDDADVEGIVEVVPFAVAVCICALGFRYLQRREARRGAVRSGTRWQAIRRAFIVTGLLILAPTVAYSVASLASMSTQQGNALAAVTELGLLLGVFAWRLARGRP
jgi:hypothetical protein